MRKDRPTSPVAPLPRQDHYEIALRAAQIEIATASPAEMAEKAGVCLVDDQTLSVSLIGRTYHVALPHGSVTAADGAEPPVWEQILVLHYLRRADGTTPTGRWVRFADLEDGHFYQVAFSGRSEGRFLGLCCANVETWTAGAAALGGAREDYADVSFAVPALPRVSVLLALWQGDDELPPAARILFDESLNHYLSTEDAAVLCDILLGRLKRETALAETQ